MMSGHGTFMHDVHIFTIAQILLLGSECPLNDSLLLNHGQSFFFLPLSDESLDHLK